MNTFYKSLKFLERYIPTPQNKHPGSLGFERMEYLCKLLGNPQFAYPTIHVGGTSGKGSTSTIIASILATKYKVGLHTSPHLVRVNERIAIYRSSNSSSNKTFFGDAEHPTSQKTDNTLPSLCESLPPRQYRHFSTNLGQTFKTPQKTHPSQELISDGDFTDFVNIIKPSIKMMEKGKYGPPSFFEIITAMAFLYFKKQKVDIAVIEVGMGGRYDATNVVKPMAAVLTNVGLDHTDILGDTVEKIAVDKVGIIKPGVQVVTGVKQKSVLDIVKRKALSVKHEDDKLSVLGRDFSYKVKAVTEKGSIFDYFGKKTYRNLRINMLGQHQVENASLALRALEEISNSKFQISNLNLQQGLDTAFIPGRLEIIQRNPLVILDGAHNPDKMRALVQSVKTIFTGKKVTAIIAIKQDKNADEMLRILLPICQKAVFTSYEIKADQGIIKSNDPDLLAKKAGKAVSGVSVNVFRQANEALTTALKTTGRNGLILVTGSLYLLGAFKTDANENN